MQKTYITKDIPVVKDYSKGQKIAAALYLVTNHLSDNEPLKTRIRSDALGFIQSADTTHSSDISGLLNVAVLAGLISEQHVAIITRGIANYTNPTHEPSVLEPLFPSQDSSHSITVKHKNHSPSFMSDNLSISNGFKNHKNGAIIENKHKRQNQILSFINERKSVGIKDIALLFTDVSEKTIQRELLTLVESGKITKRGSKRWSIYLAVN